MSRTDVVIIGAGPTGLTAALLLAEYGINFRIIDKKAGPTEESRALGVQPRTLELWDKFDLAEGVLRNGQALNSLHLLTKDGNSVKSKPFIVMKQDDDDYSPYKFTLTYEQYKTERLFVGELQKRGISIDWNTEVKDLTQHADSVTVTIQNEAGKQETIQADWLFGADGAHSFVRRIIDLSFEGKTYEEMLFVADVDMQWDFDRDNFFADLSGLGFLAFFPLRGDGYSTSHYRIIGTASDEMEAKDSIHAQDIQDYLDKYSIVKAKIKATPWVSKYRISRRMTEQFRVNRIFLMGDSAHIHSPSGGQGMNTGIQDAWNIAWKVALVVRGEAHPNILDSYEPERMPVARAILNGSDKGFTTFTSRKLPWRWLRPMIIPIAPSLIKFLNLGSTLARYTSQVWISYRNSPAVAEEDKTLKQAQAGDRAPHAVFASGDKRGQSILTLMRGVQHHLLIFATDDISANALSTEANATLEKYAIEIQSHIIPASETAIFEAYDVQSPTAILVRPDGHIAWRGKSNSVSTLGVYLDQFFVSNNEKQKILKLADATKVS